MRYLKLPFKLSLKQNNDLRIIVVALLYYVFARLGYFLAFKGTTTLPTWPPAGMGFALLLLLGRSSWPGITIGSLIASLMAYWHNESLSSHTVILVSSGIALSSTLEALTGCHLMREWIQDKFPFNSTKNAFRCARRN